MKTNASKRKFGAWVALAAGALLVVAGIPARAASSPQAMAAQAAPLVQWSRSVGKALGREAALDARKLRRLIDEGETIAEAALIPTTAIHRVLVLTAAKLLTRVGDETAELMGG